MISEVINKNNGFPGFIHITQLYYSSYLQPYTLSRILLLQSPRYLPFFPDSIFPPVINTQPKNINSPPTMKRAFKSISDFKEYLNQSFKAKSTSPHPYGRYVADTVSSLSTLMKTCKGRGKICSIIQYLAALYYCCNKYSALDSVRDEFMAGMSISSNIALKTKESMRSARKVFKFLKFIEMTSSLLSLTYSQHPLYLVLLKLAGLITAIINNIVDNLLWGINIGVLSSVIDTPTFKRWKALKYSTDLLRLIFKLIYNTVEFHLKNKEMETVLSNLAQHADETVEEDNTPHVLCLKYIYNRREIRFQVLDSIIMVLRITMLVRRLRLPGQDSQYITPIFHSSCGLVASVLSVVKLLLEKPTLVKIKNKDEGREEYHRKEGEGVGHSGGIVKRVRFSTASIKFQGMEEIENEEEGQRGK